MKIMIESDLVKPVRNYIRNSGFISNHALNWLIRLGLQVATGKTFPLCSGSYQVEDPPETDQHYQDHQLLG